MLTLTPEQFVTRLHSQNAALKKLFNNDLPRIIGVEAVNHFKENFQNEGFDKVKWKEVKRRENSWSRGADRTRKILTGKTGDLGRSIHYRTESGKAIIFSDLIYAPVHNFGLRAGRGGGFLMPKRQFIGDSQELDTKLRGIIQNKINNILQ